MSCIAERSGDWCAPRASLRGQQLTQTIVFFEATAECFVFTSREASSAGHELDVPQQFGVWQVAGLGIVVAFRGTASQEDVIIDANISPVPLDAARATRGMGSCLTASTLQDKAPCIEELLCILKGTRHAGRLAADAPSPPFISFICCQICMDLFRRCMCCRPGRNQGTWGLLQWRQAPPGRDSDSGAGMR